VKTTRVSGVFKARAPSEALRSRVVAAARESFLRSGFVRVTMDEIAANLRLSKATLYKLFANKEDLLRAVIQGFMREVLAAVEGIIGDKTLGFIEKLAALSFLMGRRLAEIGPLLARDIRQAAPRLWQEVEDFRREKILANFRRLIDDGRREGVFRDDLDPDLAVHIYVLLVDELLNPEAILRLGRPPGEIFRTAVEVYFQGMLTERGRREFAAKAAAVLAPRKENIR
jgi:AcrR family transcriptional regulator